MTAFREAPVNACVVESGLRQGSDSFVITKKALGSGRRFRTCKSLDNAMNETGGIAESCQPPRLPESFNVLSLAGSEDMRGHPSIRVCKTNTPHGLVPDRTLQQADHVSMQGCKQPFP